MHEVVLSKNGIPIRLADERWAHITDEHCELAGMRLEILETVSDPRAIFEGNKGEVLAIQEIEPGKWSVVIYREQTSDGFIITALITKRLHTIQRRPQIWPPQT